MTTKEDRKAARIEALKTKGPCVALGVAGGFVLAFVFILVDAFHQEESLTDE